MNQNTATNDNTAANENSASTADVAGLRAQLAALTEALAATLVASKSAQGVGHRITVADLATKTLAGLTTNTARTYGSYIRFLAIGDPAVVGPDGKPWAGMGARWADEVLTTDLEQVLRLVHQRQIDQSAIRAENRDAATWLRV
jgi:hypothetical protein